MLNTDTYPHIINKLHALYEPHGLALFQRHGATYPLTVRYTNLEVPPDSVLSPHPPSELWTRDDLPIYDDELVPRYKAEGRRLFNGVTFALDRFNDNVDGHSVRLHAKLGRYFDFISSSLAMEQEFLQGDLHPMRDRLHTQVPPADVWRTGAGRSAALGAGVLTVFKHPDGNYRLIVIQRSAQTADKPGAYHVAPAFIFQPTGLEYPSSEWSIERQIKREYLEELFNVTEMEDGGVDPAEVPAAQELETMLDSGQASLHFTGFSMNMITTQVSFCALLLIHQPGWFQEHMGSTWEVGNLQVLPFATDADVLAHLPPDFHIRVTPNGAAALWLGVDRARALLRTG
ncbi:MAG: hypothetical protein AAF653_20055 [Chloroflexota bacterium]